MSRIVRMLAAVAVIAVISLTLAAPARAQWGPAPPLPSWGDYDSGHVWHNAGWWWTNQADWARTHHPDWWGDFDEHHQWQPAWWWWHENADWVRAHHPEWWGDVYDGAWYPGAMVVAVLSRLGPPASSRMVGRCLSGRVVSRGVVVDAPTGLGARASSRMVGRSLRGLLVSRSLVVDVSSRCIWPTIRIGGARFTRVLWYPAPMVVAVPSGLGARASSRMVGRFRRRSFWRPAPWWWDESTGVGARKPSRMAGRLRRPSPWHHRFMVAGA